MSRSVAEWVGKDDDARVPTKVRLRVFERFSGTCGICNVKIVAKRWVCDHKVAIINGGPNCESNLWPIHETCDRKIKTPTDVGEKRVNNRVKAKHLGLHKRKGRPMPGTRDSGIKMKIGGGWERR